MAIVELNPSNSIALGKACDANVSARSGVGQLP